VPGFFNQSVAPRSARPAVTPSPAAAQFVKVEQTVESADGEKLVRPRGPKPDVGTGNGPLFGYSVATGGSGKGQSGNGLAIVPNGAVFTSAGEDAAVGVKWGSWAGGSMTVGGLAAAGPAHVIDSSMKTTSAQLAALPSSVTTATYSYAGGSVANFVKDRGMIQRLDVGVDFSKQMITSYELQAKVIGDWHASGSGSFSQFTGTSGIALTGTCTGCTPGGAPNVAGTAHGAFVGPKAEGMITTFGLTSAGQAISGAANLKRP